MAKDGKKLELFEILAAKRAKGKIPLGLEAKSAKQANVPDPEPDTFDAPGMIIDDAVGADLARRKMAEKETTLVPSGERTAPEPPSETEKPAPPAEPTYTEHQTQRQVARPAAVPESVEPPPEPRPRSPKEVVFSLDVALFCFLIVLGLVTSSYFIGYRRGQEERPAGLIGVTEIETADPGRLNIRHLSPPPRVALRPAETDYTLAIRKEPAGDELPERLELELGEALARGRRESGREIPGFIFRTSGTDPYYVLAVGLGHAANDQELGRLQKIFNEMEGINLSREPRPYGGCRIALIRELGTPVY